MSAATILEGQAHAHIVNAMRGYSAQQQLAAAEAVVKKLHAVLLRLEQEQVAYAVVARRPVLVQAARMCGAIGIQMRDELNEAPRDVLLHYRAEAMRAIADGTTLAEHIDRLLANDQGAIA